MISLRLKNLILSTFVIIGFLSISSVAHASTFTKTLYAWARDAAGNVSSSLSDSVTITLPDQYNTYYIAPNGNDTTGSGTIDNPWLTLNKAWAMVQSGDTIYVRGGTYAYTQSQDLTNKSGTANNLIKIFAYLNEKPIFDWSATTFTSGKSGIWIYNSNYLHVKGIRITGLQQTGDFTHTGMLLWDSSNSTIENCEFDHIGGYGLQIAGNSSNDLILNCDAHHNADPLSTGDPWGGSNGFNITGQTAVTNITFRNCRAWFNSDDGWDLYGSNGYYELDNCWAFWNGYDDETFTPRGNGSGFKMGPNSNGTQTSILRKITNSLAFENLLAGFDANFSDNSTNHFPSILYNNISYKNAVGFWYAKYDDVHLVKNNISYENTFSHSFNSSSVLQTNSWQGVTVNDADFLSVSSVGMDGPRQADGSLPDLNFLKLVSGSNLIDIGVDVGLPYNGIAPDIGAFETNY